LSLALGSLPAAGRARAAANALQQPAGPTSSPSAASPTAETAATTPASSRVWIGHNAEYEEFLRTAVIERTSNPSVGVTGGTRHAYFKPGGLAAGGAFRNLGPGRY